ncbi:MAG: hypothetical protein HY830_03090 [Actinobacteria bacterium]|nr:hypothetical protein [Actinomycetota bacterium]
MSRSTVRGRRRTPADVAAWLHGGPSLREMRETFPNEWATVEARVGSLVQSGDRDALRAYLMQAAQTPRQRIGHAKPQREIVAEAVRQQMTLEAIRQAALRAETGATGSTVLRLGLAGGWIMQRLFFESGLRRKAVSWTAFRLLWPLLPHRRRLMALVRPRGVYCFYARPLITALAQLIDGRPCLEIAAGDGTLARLLTDAGVHIVATDDHSWEAHIDYGDTIVKETAATSLRTRRPVVVLCSYPPPGNTFERLVFTTPSVETYIVVTSSDEANAGDWDAYRDQTPFAMTEDLALGRLVLPHHGRVLVFRRRTENPLS